MEEGEISETDSTSTAAKILDQDPILSTSFNTQRSILPVAHFLPDLDASPQTGEEYLMLVRIEASKLALLQRATDEAVIAIAHSPSSISSLSCSSDSQATEFIKEFVAFKERLSANKANEAVNTPPSLHANDEKGWYWMLYGAASESVSFVECFSACSSKLLFVLLRYHRKWISEKWQAPDHGEGIIELQKRILTGLYALLCCVEFPFSGDELWNLRQICQVIVQGQTIEEAKIILCIARLYYHQYDL